MSLSQIDVKVDDGFGRENEIYYLNGFELLILRYQMHVYFTHCPYTYWWLDLQHMS